MRRKILMGVLALALPVGTMAAMSPSAFAGGHPDAPISCTGFNGLVTFGGGAGLTLAGTHTSAKISAPTTVSTGNFSCTGGTNNAHVSGGALTIAGSKNTKLPKAQVPKGSPIKYLTNNKGAFTTAAGSFKKTLKVINFVINGHAEQFKTKGATEIIGGACPGEVGFQLSGQVKLTPYNVKVASVRACLGVDSGAGTTGNIGVDLFNSSTLVTAQIDPAHSVATL